MVLMFLQAAFAADMSGIVSFNGEAVSAASIYAIDARHKMIRTSTDENGGFLFTDLELSQYRLAIIPPLSSDAQPEFYPGADSICDAEILLVSDAAENIQIALTEGVSVFGQLIDSDLNPITSGLILFENDLSAFADGAYSDEDGYFAIRGLKPSLVEGWRCSLEIEDFPDQSCDQNYEINDAPLIEIDANDRDLGSLTPLNGISVSGQILTDSSPANNAEVFVYSESQVKSTRTDADGQFGSFGLPPGDVLVWAQTDGFATVYYPDADRPQDFIPAPNEGQAVDNIEINLPIQSTLAITLQDIQTGNGIEGSSVLLYNDTQTVGKGAPANDEGTATIKGLHDGEYQLQYYAKNDGYQNGWLLDANGEREWISLDSETNHELTVSLHPTSQISGLIKDDRGKPVYGAVVKIQSDLLSEQATTNVEGEFTIYGLEEGDYFIEASYSPLCSNDHSYVGVYYPDAKTTLTATPFVIGDPDTYELEMEMPFDEDADGMPNSWEDENGLDSSRPDAEEDPDQDGISNIDEYLEGSDPNDADPKTDSCSGCANGKAMFMVGILTLFRRRRR